ncbi:MAG TPA: hypothetical protein VIL66_01250 [Bacillota bacterium]
MDAKTKNFLEKICAEFREAQAEVSAGLAEHRRENAEELKALFGAVEKLSESIERIGREQKACTERLAVVQRMMTAHSGYTSAKDFVITAEEKERVVLPEGKIGVTEFARCINAVIDLNKSRRLTGVELNKQLKKMGILSEKELEDGKKRTITNEQSHQYGIETEIRTFNGVDYEMVVFNEQGKEFLLENLEKIMSYSL